MYKNPVAYLTIFKPHLMALVSREDNGLGVYSEKPTSAHCETILAMFSCTCCNSTAIQLFSELMEVVTCQKQCVEM